MTENDRPWPARFQAVALTALVAALVLTWGSGAHAQPNSNDDGCGASNPLLDFTCEVADEVGDVATAPIRYAAGSAADTITSWVADTAIWLLKRVIGFIDDSTSPDLTSEWFRERYRLMIGIASLVLVPMLLVAAIRAVIQQDLSQLVRSFFLYLPVAILGTFVTVFLAQSLLTVTDELSAVVAEGIGKDMSRLFESVGDGLGGVGGLGQPVAPSFAIFFGALLLIVGSFFVWLELLIRSAAVTVAVFFMPLMLAGLVWPATARWTRRVVETLVALILSKFVIVAVISLATAALAEPGTGGFGAVMGGAALMLMAAFSPFALLKLMPIAEGAAISHLEGMGRKPVEAVRSGGSVNHAVSIMRSRIGSGGDATSAPVPRVSGPVTAGTVAAGSVASDAKPTTDASGDRAPAPARSDSPGREAAAQRDLAPRPRESDPRPLDPRASRRRRSRD